MAQVLILCLKAYDDVIKAM